MSLLVVEDRPVDRVVGVVAPAGFEVGSPAAKAVQLALAGADAPVGSAGTTARMA